MTDQPVPAWSLDGLSAEPEPPVHSTHTLTDQFTLLPVTGFKVAQAMQYGQYQAAHILVR